MRFRVLILLIKTIIITLKKSCKNYIKNTEIGKECLKAYNVFKANGLAPSGENYLLENNGALICLPRNNPYAASGEEFLSYDKSILMIINHIVKENDNVIEIGAANAIHTINLSKRVGKNGRIFAFEPVRYNFERIKLQINLNRVENVELYNQAVGKEKGKCCVY